MGIRQGALGSTQCTLRRYVLLQSLTGRLQPNTRAEDVVQQINCLPHARHSGPDYGLQHLNLNL